MPLFASRKRLVTFRLTTEEYEALRGLCISKGVRSISELTRDAVLQQLLGDRGSKRGSFETDLMSLMSELEQIDEAIQNLSGRISRILGPSGGSAGSEI
jgi:hypothetical protein